MTEFPKCPRCNRFQIVPLSDYGSDTGGSVKFKAWVCLDERCGWTLRIDRGLISFTRDKVKP
jgi:hypothetical protein